MVLPRIQGDLITPFFPPFAARVAGPRCGVHVARAVRPCHHALSEHQKIRGAPPGCNQLRFLGLEIPVNPIRSRRRDVGVRLAPSRRIVACRLALMQIAARVGQERASAVAMSAILLADLGSSSRRRRSPSQPAWCMVQIAQRSLHVAGPHGLTASRPLDRTAHPLTPPTPALPSPSQADAPTP
jgi:hypothetical protein